MADSPLRIGIVESGLIGRAWAVAFARSGCQVKLNDPADGVAAQALPLVADTCEAMAKLDLLNGRKVAEVGDTVGDADYVQENSPERRDIKITVFTELDEATRPDAIIGSSTSAILPSVFTSHVKYRERCIVVHPLNPPHIIPAVEVVPAPWTSQQTITRARDIMLDIGQKLIIVARGIDGFLWF